MKLLMPETGPGSEWHKLPAQIYSYGGGGVNKWGTLCGALNGCMAVLNLMGLHGTVGEELMGWYCTTKFPTGIVCELYNQGGWSTTHVPVPDDEVLAHTVANSPLCHNSISKWFAAAGVGYTDKDSPDWCCGPHTTYLKKDRCAKVTAATARKAAELINEYVEGVFGQTDWITGTDYEDCIKCHSYVGGSTPPYSREDTLAKADCTECHTPGNFHRRHALVIEDVWTSDAEGNPKAQFTAGDDIQYIVRFATLGPGSTFLKAVKSKAVGTCGRIQRLTRSETCAAGTYTWTWMGTVPTGCTGKAKVVINFKMFDYKGGNLLNELRKIHRFDIL